MATCKVHDEAAKHARKLIDAGTYDDTTDLVGAGTLT